MTSSELELGRPAATRSEGNPAHGRRRNGALELVVTLVVLAALLVIPELAGSAYWAHAAQLIGLYAIASIAQNLLVSDAGQASFGQGAVFGVAAYVVAIATAMHGIPLASASVLAVLAAVILGLLFALPALRVQHFYLGFVTLSAAVVLPELAMVFSDYTNGLVGISISFPALKQLSVLGIPLLTIIILLLALTTAIGYWLLRGTRFGRQMRIAAESTEAAQSLGIKPGRMRFLAFLIAAVPTGIAGALYPAVVGFVGPTSFTIELSMLFFFAVVVGGRGTILGPVVGLFLLYLLPNALLAQFVEYRQIAYGVAALAVMLLLPDGVVGTIQRRWLAAAGRRVAPSLDVPFPEAALSDLVPATRHVGPGTPVLAVRRGNKSFGNVAALSQIDLEVREGEIHGLVGANGSGKTSLLNVLSGFSTLDSGTLELAGNDIRGWPADRIARSGVGRTFQKPRILNGLTLWENVLVGLEANPHASRFLLEHSAEVRDLRASLGMSRPEWVPHGQRRLLEVLRVSLAGPRVLLLDEPAAGLSSAERDRFATLLARLRHVQNAAVVLVEHDLEFVWKVADRITVLDAGRVAVSGTPAEVAASADARHLFI